MAWTRVLVLSITFLAFYVWMALALGAVLAKLGVPPRSAWIPVQRYVVAARAAELPTAPVLISRCVAAVAWLAFVVVVLLRSSDAVPGSSGLRTFATFAFAIGVLGSLAGWIMWIATANRLELRLVVQRQLWWLAALLPPAWASVVGFGGTRPAVGGPVTGSPAPLTAAQEADDATRAIRHVAAPLAPRAVAAPEAGPEPAPIPEPQLEPKTRPKLEPEPEPKPEPASAAPVPITAEPPLPREEEMTTEEHDITSEVPRVYSPYDIDAAPLTPVPMPADPLSPWGYEDDDDATFFAQRRRARWVLRVVGAEEYDLEDITTIGREGIRPIPGVLPIIDDTRTMSKLHARLRRESDNWFVTDLGSTNGTFVRDPSGAELEVKAQSEAKIEGTLLLGDLEAIIIDQRELAS